MQVCPPGLARSHKNMGKRHITNTKEKPILTKHYSGSETNSLQGLGGSRSERKRPRLGRTKQREPEQKAQEGPLEQLLNQPKLSSVPRATETTTTRDNTPD